MTTKNVQKKVLLWGTYDVGKPRTRLIRKALSTTEFELVEIHTDVWSSVEDKSQIKGLARKAMFAFRWLIAYPGLIIRYLRADRHDVVVIRYLGHLDILVLWPFARLRGVPIVWDAFLSIPDTIVSDRKLVRNGGVVAKALNLWECLACRAANKVVLDTDAHAELFRANYELTEDRVGSVFVGAEADQFRQKPKGPHDGDIRILFYGQFIPLHGLETVVKAAALTVDAPYRWTIIGQGQEAARIDKMIAEDPKVKIDRIKWVDYETLVEHIAEADICLGIFGDTGKSARVIPNKAFQILAAGRPIITRDSPAIRELLTGDEPGVRLIPPADAEALVSAVEDLADTRLKEPLHTEIICKFSTASLAVKWQDIINSVAK